MTDAHEQKLIGEYRKALAALRRLPRGHPGINRASTRLVETQRALKRYRQIQETKDQN